MNVGEPLIRLEKLTKVFGSGETALKALDEVDLEIYKGDIFGIIGVSGAGKSTLVRCINFLERPSGGTVFFDGKDLNRLSEKELYRVRQSMGMIFQQFNLLMQRTALDNICFPLEIAGQGKVESRRRAAELLELVGIPDKADAYPAQLSGGQRQRVAIARALATNPQVLLCDEATSALDPGTTRGVLALLKEINKTLGVTVVVITHEMTVVEEICNKVAVIDEHKIAETGDVSEVFIRTRSRTSTLSTAAAAASCSTAIRLLSRSWQIWCCASAKPSTSSSPTPRTSAAAPSGRWCSNSPRTMFPRTK